MAELFHALLDFRADLVCILIHELLEDQRLLLRVDNFHQLFPSVQFALAIRINCLIKE